MNLKQFFFKYRSYTPLPFILLILFIARPTLHSIVTGGVFMVLGELIRIWGVSYAGGATRTRTVGASQLVTNGPFAHLRNPLYLGNLFMYAGAALMANTWQPWLVILVLVYFSIQYYFIIQLEEEKLNELFGEAYRQYCTQVPRIVPKLKGAPSANPVKPDLKNALQSEKSTFMSFTAIVLIYIVLMLLRQ